MKCNVCGAESGKYPLCRACNVKKEKGEIIKCEKCGKWHHSGAACPISATDNKYLYEMRKTLISKSEQEFYNALKASLPQGYCVFPQINLTSFIDRTDNSRFHNELFRNVDFLITDEEYQPKIIVEINDKTHLTNERKERDEKVKKICEEAGIPILNLWTSYGINAEYIKGRINETLEGLPMQRVCHFVKQIAEPQKATTTTQSLEKKKTGCFIATCVYGSYDCPEVWVLRRFRDYKLSNNFFGKLFIKIYYQLSPSIVKTFGKYNWFINIFRNVLDKVVKKLQIKGFADSPYNDKF